VLMFNKMSFLSANWCWLCIIGVQAKVKYLYLIFI
jgi:hypothetical protein